MRLLNLKQVDDFKVRNWIEKSIPELTVYQKEKIRENEIVRFAPFYFMEKGKKVNNLFLRLSIILIIPTIAIMVILLPVNFIITGNWGYSDKSKWIGNWITKCGL